MMDDVEWEATCGACGAPLFAGDDYRIDGDGFVACPAAFVDDKDASGLACHAHRMGDDDVFSEQVEAHIARTYLQESPDNA